MAFTRVILKPLATWKDLCKTESKTLNSNVWKRISFTPHVIDHPYRKAWQSIDGHCSIVYLQDPLREIRYYQLTGPTLGTHAEFIRGRIATYDRAEIETLMATAASTAEKVAAIYHAALLAPHDCDSFILDFLTKSLGDSEPAFRRAAIDAALIALWPELREALEGLARDDTDSELRTFAAETLERLQTTAWASPNEFNFEPLPPDKNRIKPQTDVHIEWHIAAHGSPPEPPRVPVAPKILPEFQLPDWLSDLIATAAWPSIEWHTPEQIRAASTQVTEFVAPIGMAISDSTLGKYRALWEQMIPVADGPSFTDRVERITRSRLFVNRDDPSELLFAVATDHPPSFWLPAGRTAESVKEIANAYFFPGIPPSESLPFQGRVFLETEAGIGGFVEVERCVERSPFTDFLPWGSSHPSDPYPDSAPLGRVPPAVIARCMAKDPDQFPRMSIRTRFSRSVIRLTDWNNGYFADLFFVPAPPTGWTEAYNLIFGRDFPPGTPIDVVGALSGLSCFGPDRIREQAEDSDDSYQRWAMEKIILPAARPMNLFLGSQL